MAGHLICSEDQPICDFVAAGKKVNHYFVAAIHARAGGAPLLISFSSGFNGPGTWMTDNIEGGVSITLDGATHWESAKGDRITITTGDQQLLRGTLDSTLTASNFGPVHLTGGWTCDRISTGT